MVPSGTTVKWHGKRAKGGDYAQALISTHSWCKESKEAAAKNYDTARCCTGALTFFPPRSDTNIAALRRVTGGGCRTAAAVLKWCRNKFLCVIQTMREVGGGSGPDDKTINIHPGILRKRWKMVAHNTHGVRSISTVLLVPKLVTSGCAYRVALTWPINIALFISRTCPPPGRQFGAQWGRGGAKAYEFRHTEPALRTISPSLALINIEALVENDGSGHEKGR